MSDDIVNEDKIDEVIEDKIEEKVDEVIRDELSEQWLQVRDILKEEGVVEKLNSFESKFSDVDFNVIEDIDDRIRKLADMRKELNKELHSVRSSLNKVEDLDKFLYRLEKLEDILYFGLDYTKKELRGLE